MEALCLSVGELVAFALRSGDINAGYIDPTVRQEGARLHRKIQKEMGGDYRSEVALEWTARAAEPCVILQGRADGIFTDENGLLTVDEIKTTAQGLAQLEKQEALHLAQAKCYARMYLQTLENPPEEMGICLTYCEAAGERIQRRRFAVTRTELTEFVEELLEKYLRFWRFRLAWMAQRDASIAALEFPFPRYRAGQRKLAAAVYCTVQDGGRFFAQAPTGIGKTVSTLFPCLKAMGEGKTERLFYLTAKTVTRTVAQEALLRMQAGGLRCKSVILRAKEKICFCETPQCNPQDCLFAAGHFDRVNEAVLDILQNEDCITPEITQDYARRHRVCPHEFALDAALWADVIIGDYNHVFDPVVYLRRFFGRGEQTKSCFLIDEAHNLADRAREMYSAALHKSDFLQLKRSLTGKDAASRALRAAAQQINAHLLACRKENAPRRHIGAAEQDEALRELARQFEHCAQEWLSEHAQTEAAQALLPLFFAVRHYLLIAEGYGECYCTLTEFDGAQVTATLFCLDPAPLLEQRLDWASASILFSATLSPLPYYRELLGGGADAALLSLPSPFAAEKLALTAHCGISTKYREREQSIAPIAECIYLSVTQKAGNHLVFFPSHAYLRQVYEHFTAYYPEVETLCQRSEMQEEERAAFLARFDAKNTQTLVGFCVLGGIFAEGVDLVGERLVGAVIVGVGLPQLSLQRDAIRQYYDEKNGQGYDFAYVYPGMNKVLQAAGRVIRSETDEGSVLLIDSRFASAKYRALFPEHWQHIRMVRDYSDEPEIH